MKQTTTMKTSKHQQTKVTDIEMTWPHYIIDNAANNKSDITANNNPL